MNSYAPTHSLNLEYFFRVIYDLAPQGSAGNYTLWLTHIWTFVGVVSYLITFAFLAVLAYTTIRLAQLREEEEPMYATLPQTEAELKAEHSRWEHILSLIESGSESDWRQAIIESDIMLDDILRMHGYEGATVADRLKMGDPERFHTLQDAWDAHKVRNDIAHQGSSYKLTDHVAYRTIGKYKNVFEEFHAI